MLNIRSQKNHSFCDHARRNFLKVGALGIGSLTLADLFRLEATAGIGSSTKALINIHLGGGPSHQDMFDLKPNAPSEYRGEFNPVATNVPGMDICEHFPLLAERGDKFAIIRSLTGMINSHSDFHTQTGYSNRDLQNVGGRPAIGSVIAKLQGPNENGAPPLISYSGDYPGYLGPVYRAYKPQGGSLKLNRSLTEERLHSRTDLLADMDRIRRDMDKSGQMSALDSYTQRAVDVVTSGEVANALDINKEDKAVVERYGNNDGRMFLTARRLVEAGVRVVNFRWGSWDTHSNNFKTLSKQLPKLDRALSALLDDLHARGMSDDVTVVMWGEFGRTPRINKNAGRDHWPRLATCFLAGGGMRTGQVIGRSTKFAEAAQDRPVMLQEVFATLYHNFGIDVEKTTLQDPNGRPQFLVDHRTPIHELI